MLTNEPLILVHLTFASTKLTSEMRKDLRELEQQLQQKNPNLALIATQQDVTLSVHSVPLFNVLLVEDMELMEQARNLLSGTHEGSAFDQLRERLDVVLAERKRVLK